ncbi:MAG: DUF1343 domain-containing protein [Bacteroidetes bacterium]|nr:DUF1343 domain-containing protein [Bacteroidota bacterium]
MKIFTTIFIILILFTNLSCQSSDSNNHVFFGDELLLKENIELLIDKRVGVVTNHSAVLPNNVHLVDTLLSLGINITALFSPEHGIRGEISDGSKILSSTDDKTGIPIFSLYGKTKKPTKEMLNNIDIILFGIQDIGARFYTYIYTMALAMEAAALNGKQFIVLDRPNPITGSKVEGPMLQRGFETFVGMYPMPVRHGMTVGELALLFKGEGWIKGAESLDLKIVPMKGWTRDLWFDQTDVSG